MFAIISFAAVSLLLLAWLILSYLDGKPMQNPAFANGLWWFFNVSMALLGHTFDNPVIM